MKKLTKLEITSIIFRSEDPTRISTVVPFELISESDSMYYVMNCSDPLQEVLVDLREVVRSKLLTKLYDDPTRIYGITTNSRRLSIKKIELYPGLCIPANEENLQAIIDCMTMEINFNISKDNKLTFGDQSSGIALKTIINEDAVLLWETVENQQGTTNTGAMEAQAPTITFHLQIVND